LAGCDNFIGEKREVYIQCIRYLELVQRSEDRYKFGIFRHSLCKTVLNLLEVIWDSGVTVVKFVLDDRGSDGTGCFNFKDNVIPL